VSRIGYADPPYPGQSAKHYADHPDYAGEVDHRQLLKQLDADYDGWLLHTSATALPEILGYAEELGVGPYRVMAWVKPFAAFKRNVSVAYAWEPVLVKPIRKPVVTKRIVMRDWVSCNITMQKGLTGVKPQDVCNWAFEMLGAEPDDELCDLFPGSGAVTAAWRAWCEQVRNEQGGPQNMITTKLAPPLRVDCPRDRFKRPVMVADPADPTGALVTYQRVTTLAGMIDDTYNLTLWKMRGVAKGVAWRDDLRIAAATTDDSTKDGKAALDEICEKALDAAGGGAGAAMGTAFHRVTQIADAYPDVPAEQYCPPELRQELSAYVALVKTHGLILRPEYQERTGICPDAGVAGTWDDLVLGGPHECGRYHVGDKKSGQHEFEYGQGKIAAQLAMYARMTTLWLATGGGYEAPPAICPEVGYVLYVPIGRADEACVYPVDLIEGWNRVELAMQIREARSAKRGLFGPALTLTTGVPALGISDDTTHANDAPALKPRRARRTRAQAEADKLAADVAVVKAEPVLDLNDPADAAIHESEHRHDGTAFLMNGELKPGPADPLDEALTALDEAVTVAEVTAEAAVALLADKLGAQVVPATVERVRPDKSQLNREREAAYAGLRNGTTAQTEMERGKLADAIASARGQDDLITAYGLWSAHWTPEHDQMAVRRLIDLMDARSMDALPALRAQYEAAWTDDLTRYGVRRHIGYVGTREGLDRLWEIYQSVWTDDLTAAGNDRLAELARL